MFFFFDYYSLSLFLGGIVALVSGGIVFLSDSKKQEHIAWMLLNLATAVWSFGYFVMSTATTKEVAVLSNVVLHYGAIFIPFLYFYFIINLVNEKGILRKWVLPTLSFPLLFFIAINPTELFVRDVFPKYIFNFAPDAGVFYGWYAFYFFAVSIFSGGVLLRACLKAKNEEAVKLWHVFASSFAGFLGGGSVFFLTFNIPIPPFPIVLFAFYPLIITYAILRHRLFNAKVVSTELLTFALWVFLLFRTLLSENTTEQFINLILFLATVVLGIFLIRSVIREVEIRERVEKLAVDLEKANMRLKELDNMKNEFLSFASHQLRSPLTAVKGYASMILEGSFGELNKEQKGAVQRVFTSTENLVKVVNEFLDVSRIEQGRMAYDYSSFDLKALTEEVIGEFKPNVLKAKLTISFEHSGGTSKIKADYGKTKQIIGNILDNAIKYTPKGSIMVTLSNAKGKAILSFADTGIGIPKGEISKLFSKFTRAKDANKTDVGGTGLGMYVAKNMVEAQGGKIWVESEGVGKGSTFRVELPLA